MGSLVLDQWHRLDLFAERPQFPQAYDGIIDLVWFNVLQLVDVEAFRIFLGKEHREGSKRNPGKSARVQYATVV